MRSYAFRSIVTANLAEVASAEEIVLAFLSHDDYYVSMTELPVGDSWSDGSECWRASWDAGWARIRRKEGRDEDWAADVGFAR